jgi:hypothetical protein
MRSMQYQRFIKCLLIGLCQNVAEWTVCESNLQLMLARGHALIYMIDRDTRNRRPNCVISSNYSIWQRLELNNHFTVKICMNVLLVGGCQLCPLSIDKALPTDLPVFKADISRLKVLCDLPKFARNYRQLFQLICLAGRSESSATDLLRIIVYLYLI